MDEESKLNVSVAVLTEQVKTLSCQVSKLENSISAFVTTMGEHNRIVENRINTLEKWVPDIQEHELKLEGIEPKIKVIMAIPAIITGAWGLIQLIILLVNKLQ